MINHSDENEFNVHVNEVSFSYERMSTETHFEKGAKGSDKLIKMVNFKLANEI